MADAGRKGTGVELDEVCKMFYKKAQPIGVCDPDEWCNYGIYDKIDLLKRMIDAIWMSEVKEEAYTNGIEILKKRQRDMEEEFKEKLKKKSEESEREYNRIYQKCRDMENEYHDMEKRCNDAEKRYKEVKEFSWKLEQKLIECQIEKECLKKELKKDIASEKEGHSFSGDTVDSVVYWDSDHPPGVEQLEALEKKWRCIQRDEKGRLKKDSMIARKRNCDEDSIWWYYMEEGMSVKDIVALLGCSKSTVYNVIKKFKKKENGT